MAFAALLEAVHREVRSLDDIPARRAAEAAREKLRAAGVPAPGEERAPTASPAADRNRRDQAGAASRDHVARIDPRERTAGDSDPGRTASGETASARSAEPPAEQIAPTPAPDARRGGDDHLAGLSAGPSPTPAAAPVPGAGHTGSVVQAAAPQQGSAGVSHSFGGQAAPLPANAVGAGALPAAAAPGGTVPAVNAVGQPMAVGGSPAAGQEPISPSGGTAETPGRGSGSDPAFRAALGQSARVRAAGSRPAGSGPSHGGTAEGVDFRENGAVERLARVIRSQAGPRNGKLVLHLDPPELGRVRIDVRMREGVLNVTLEAEQEAGFQAVRDHLDELRQALGRHGLQVDRLDVELRAPSPRDGSDAGGSGHHGSGGEPSSGQRHAASSGSRDPAGGSAFGRPQERIMAGRMENEVGGWTRPAESGVDLVA